MTVVPYDPQTRAVTRSNGSFDADWLLDPAEIANRIGGTEFVPKTLRNNPAAITAALLYGAEVGLGRMQSLAKIAVIDGKPTLAAEAQRALILAAGHDLWIEEQTNTRCTVAGRRTGSEMTSRVTWTLDDAKRARLAGRQNWTAYPRQMLLARASAELARAVFADVIGGLAATEELEDTVDPNAPAPATVEAETPPSATRRRKRVGTVAAQPEPAPEPAPDTPPPPDVVEPNAPSPAQIKLLFALFNERGMGERDTRLQWAQQQLGRQVQSSTELSALDVTRLIDLLQALPAAPAAKPQPDQPTAEEQAVLDALREELDAQPPQVDDQGFPPGF